MLYSITMIINISYIYEEYFSNLCNNIDFNIENTY